MNKYLSLLIGMKYYFITGTGSGLGRALAEEILQDADCRVIGLSRHNEISHASFQFVPIDLSELDQVKAFSFPGPDDLAEAKEIYLINNAATIQPVAYLGETGPDEIIRHYNLNIIAPAVLSNSFIRTFLSFAGRKGIVNISSGAAQRPTDGWSFYCSSKAALDMLTKTAAMERGIKKTGLFVVSVSPGIMDTPMQDEIREAETGSFSRLKEFRAYKEKDQLQPPYIVARKLLKLINNLQNNDTLLRI